MAKEEKFNILKEFKCFFVKFITKSKKYNLAVIGNSILYWAAYVNFAFLNRLDAKYSPPLIVMRVLSLQRKK